MINNHALESHVEQLGHLSRKELAALYQKAAICVVPSHYESFGLVALEAMAAGLAVVGARAGGLPEVIEDEITGRLVAAGDAEGLAAAIIELLASPEKRAEMGAAGRERAISKYSVQQNAALNLRVYEEMRAQATTANHA
jgi:glycosyltransferase involved in cell wall biosynthesis